MYIPPQSGTGPAPVLSHARSTAENRAVGMALLCLSGVAHSLPLFEAVDRDKIAMALLRPDQPPPLRKLDETNRPAVLVVGDDNNGTRHGPDGWPSAHRLMRWAGATMIHGAAGLPEHYEAAVLGAIQHRRLVLIETASWRVDAWSAMAKRFMPPFRILQIRPDVGVLHPTMPESETVQ